jgi:nitrate/TMAO reductase-like tetraheme cytochrome c subunit
VVLLFVARSFKGVIDTKGKRIFLLVSMVVLPGLWLLAVANHDVHEMETVAFCTQCHALDGYYESLHSKNEDSIVASHYQNNRVPQDGACYQCHADHTPVTGMVKTKLNGLREAYIEYFGHAELPLKMRKKYNTHNCLMCHEAAKNFQEAHEDDLEAIVSGETSCLECHDVAHVLPVKKSEAK